MKRKTKFNIVSLEDVHEYFKVEGANQKTAEALPKIMLQSKRWDRVTGKEVLRAPVGVLATLTMVRKAYPELSYFLKVGKEVHDKIHDATAARVLARRGNQGFNIQPDEVIKTATDLLNYNKVPMLVAGLLLLTGRRTNELFSKKVFTYNQSGECTFHNHSKTVVKPYEIPLLCDHKIILDAHAKLFKLTGEVPALEVNRLWSTQVGRVTHSFFDCNPHRLRALYAEIAFDKSDKTEPLEIFTARVLGHAPYRINATDSYL